MFLKESYVGENIDPNMHGIYDDEEEETLSFCEFSINSEADTWEDSSRDSQNSSFKSSEHEDDYFEFFSQEWSTSTSSCQPPQNIIFCGKLIPFKQPIDEKPKKVEKIQGKKHKRRGLFRWKWVSSSSNKSKSSRKCGSNDCSALQESSNNRCKKQKLKKKNDCPVRRMPILTSPVRSKWYLFLFGITRFQTKMELRDMKNRQSRRRPSCTLFRLENTNDNKNIACANASTNGFRGLLKTLSCGTCGHHQASAAVRASVGPIPQV